MRHQTTIDSGTGEKLVWYAIVNKPGQRGLI